MIHILLLPLPLLLLSSPFLFFLLLKGLFVFLPTPSKYLTFWMILPDRFSLSFLLLSLHHVKSIGLFIGIQMKYHTLQHFFCFTLQFKHRHRHQSQRLSASYLYATILPSFWLIHTLILWLFPSVSSIFYFASPVVPGPFFSLLPWKCLSLILNHRYAEILWY